MIGRIADLIRARSFAENARGAHGVGRAFNRDAVTDFGDIADAREWPTDSTAWPDCIGGWTSIAGAIAKLRDIASASSWATREFHAGLDDAAGSVGQPGQPRFARLAVLSEAAATIGVTAQTVDTEPARAVRRRYADDAVSGQCFDALDMIQSIACYEHRKNNN